MKADGTTAVAEKGAATKGAVKLPAQTLVEYLETKKASFSAMLPRGMDADRFMKMVIMAIVKVPQLASAEFTSMLEAVGACATYGLEPDGHHAAIIPFKNGKLSERKGRDVYDAVFVPMVHGLIALAYRSEAFKVISAREVCAKDDFQYSYDFDNTFRHVPAEGDRGEWVGVYAFFVLKAGGRDFIYMSRADVTAWGRRFAKSFEKKDSLWQTNLMAAGLKTAVKRVLHFAPMAIQLPMDDDDMGIRNVTPVDAPAPVFDISNAKEVAEDVELSTTPAEQPATEKTSQEGGQPELIPARQPGQG
jgi:recombination protein RecT